MVFELLGASFAFALLKMNSGEGALGFSDYLNTSKALSVIVGIFVSVAIAFTVGTVVQWPSSSPSKGEVFFSIQRVIPISVSFF